VNGPRLGDGHLAMAFELGHEIGVSAMRAAEVEPPIDSLAPAPGHLDNHRYSRLRATTGSTRVARRAGKYEATNATRANRIATAA
jgi:hypothetical protein